MDGEVPKHRKKVGKKPYAIEYRSLKIIKFDWRTWRRYATRKDMEKAFDAILDGGCSPFEYRLSPKNPE